MPVIGKAEISRLIDSHNKDPLIENDLVVKWRFKNWLVFCSSFWCLEGVAVPRTNITPENGPSQRENSSSNSINFLASVLFGSENSCGRRALAIELLKEVMPLGAHSELICVNRYKIDYIVTYTQYYCDVCFMIFMYIYQFVLICV